MSIFLGKQYTWSSYHFQKIEHAGFHREVISRNPPLIDEDGYEVDSDDDEEKVQAAMAAAAEIDPYFEVKLESKIFYGK